MGKHRVIVVGGGPAGLIAAGQAAKLGAETLLLEKMDRPGHKLCLTGQGRCNLTNIAPLPQFIEHFGPNGRFLRQTFAQFSASELQAFFEELGVHTVTERGGRVFPANGRAQDVVNALVQWVRKLGVKLHNKSAVNRLIMKGGQVIGVQVSEARFRTGKFPNGVRPSDRVYGTDAVIIATGGASYPKTGSTGDGYRLAESAGHSIVQIRPALVPLVTESAIVLRLQGLSLRNVMVRVMVDGKKRVEGFGEMVFTHFGVSGPVILSLSRKIVDSLRLGRKVYLSIDLKPALNDRTLDARLIRELNEHGKRHFQKLLKELLPRKLIPVCIDLVDIAANKVGHQITGQERKRLRMWLKNFSLKVKGSRTLDEAIITAGGVNTQEVDPRNMASRIVKGLFFAGEVLDVDADTGGYNLQAAFSTGWVAGRSAARCLKVTSTNDPYHAKH
jgi:hypothetical protein